MLVECGEHNKGAFGERTLPAVDTDEQAVDDKKHVVVGLLQGLGDGVEFALVAAAVVGLRLARNRADKVGMDAHGETDHVDCLLYVRLPVAALFGVFDIIDDHIVLLLSIRGDIEHGEPHFAAVLRACEEVDDALFLRVHTLLHLDFVGDALRAEDRFPVFGSDLDVILDRRGVAEFGFFGNGD